ncbi:UTRA domain-containing protein [Streptomyces sp. NPDC051162]|uniref:GntR family transcriptional regulator n=1 Tax=unclassified Streptomyces TaxID=2593676 RepID=UPI003442B45F
MSNSHWISSSMPYLKPDADRPDAWSAEAADRGHKGSQSIVHAGEVPAPPDVASLLGLAEGETVVVRRRIMYLDDRANELTDTYYPADIARGTPLAGTARIRGGAVKLLTALGYVGARVREDVIARMPGPEERALLQTAQDEPVLHLTRVTLDDRNRPIQVDMMTMPAHRQRLRYELTIG